MVRRRIAPSRTMRPRSCRSSFETRLSPLLRMREIAALRHSRLALPLSRPAGLIDPDRDRQGLRTTAVAGAAHRCCAEIIQTDRDAGMCIGGADAVGGVEPDP